MFVADRCRDIVDVAALQSGVLMRKKGKQANHASGSIITLALLGSHWDSANPIETGSSPHVPPAGWPTWFREAKRALRLGGRGLPR